jgi:hypothetical protein
MIIFGSIFASPKRVPASAWGTFGWKSNRGGTTGEACHPGGSLLKSLAGGVAMSGACHSLSGLAGAGEVV